MSGSAGRTLLFRTEGVAGLVPITGAGVASVGLVPPTGAVPVAGEVGGVVIVRFSRKSYFSQRYFLNLPYTLLEFVNNFSFSVIKKNVDGLCGNAYDSSLTS